MAADDFQLLDQWRDGDTQAANTLLSRHYDVVHRFYRNKVDDEVEDLAQRTFLACVAKKEQFARRTTFRAYLLRIARNLLFDHYRRRRARASRFELGSVSAVDLGASPSSNCARTQRDELLMRALREIPLDHQIALELHYWGGVSSTEIAEILELPIGTVKGRIQRARAALRERLAALGLSEPANGKA